MSIVCSEKYVTESIFFPFHRQVLSFLIAISQIFFVKLILLSFLCSHNGNGVSAKETLRPFSFILKKLFLDTWFAYLIITFNKSSKR